MDLASPTSNDQEYHFAAESYNVDTKGVSEDMDTVLDALTKDNTFQPDVVGAQELKGGDDLRRIR